MSIPASSIRSSTQSADTARYLHRSAHETRHRLAGGSCCHRPDPVPREVKEPHTPSRHVPGEILDGALHGVLIGIELQGHVKVVLPQQGGHLGGIVDRIAEGTVRIFRVADHQGQAGVGRG